MKRQILIIALVLASALSPVSGQYIEAHVALADSLSGTNEASSVAFDSVANAVYVTGWHATLVFDAASRRRLARMDEYGDWVVSAAADQKMYVLGSSVYAFDARTHMLLREIPVACETYWVTPPAAYVPALHKLYVVAGHESLVIINTRNDSVLRALPTDGDVSGLCYAPDLGKLYVMNWDSITVVDCAQDSVTAILPVWTDRFWSQAYSPVSHKLYRGGDHLVVIDCMADTIIRRERLPDFFAFMTYNPANNRIYCGYGDRAVAVIDCATDTIAAIIETPGSDYWCASCLDPATGRFYYDTGDEGAVIGVVDAVADTFVRLLFAGQQGFGPPSPNFTPDPVNSQVYFASYEAGLVPVIDARGDSILATLVTTDDFGLDELWYNPVTDRIVGLDEHIGGISIIDAAARALVGTKCVAVSPADFLFNSAVQEVYLADEAGRELVSLSLLTDTTIRRISYPGGLVLPMAASPAGDKLYVGTWNGSEHLRVIDCRTDSVAGSVEVPYSPDVLVASAQLDKVYGIYDSTLFVIDAGTDSVVRTLALRHGAGVLGYSPTQERWYCIAPRGRDTITVIDGRADTVIAVVPAPGCYEQTDNRVLWNPRTDRLYYRKGSSSSVVFDCRTNRVVGEVVMSCPQLCDTVRNRIYGIDAAGVVVLDGQTNSVIARFAIPGVGKMAWDAARGRVYVGSGSSLVTVIRDTTAPGVGDAGAFAASHGSSATVVRGVLWVGAMAIREPPSGQNRRALVLTDVAGQRVMELRPGANDVRRVVPGVYFVRSGAAGVHKIIVAK